MSVKFARECLEVYSWVKKLQYTAFCHALSSGIYQHLQVSHFKGATSLYKHVGGTRASF